MSSARPVSPVYEAAREAHRAGLTVLPTKADGSKAVALPSWSQFKTRQPSQAECRAMRFDQAEGFGVVAGRDVECWDFDDADTYERFTAAAAEAGLTETVDRVRRGYEDATPRGGRRWIVRLPPGTAWKDETLAARPRPSADNQKGKDVLIELPTFAIVAPSSGRTHPSGQPYVRVAGGFEAIATLSVQERDGLLMLARRFDECPRDQQAARAAHTTVVDGRRPGDEFNRRATWPDILQSHGWRDCGTRGDTTLWTRPGKDRGISATTNHAGTDLLYVFSSSTAFAPDRAYDKFAAYAVLNHAGEFAAAARVLGQQGYGAPRSGASLHLVTTADASGPPTTDGDTPSTLFQRLSGGGYSVAWPSKGVALEVRHLRRERAQLVGEVAVFCEWAGARRYNGMLSCADLNLSSQKDRYGRAKYCEERSGSQPGEFDWPGAFDETCLRVIEAERTGAEAIVLDDAPAVGPPRDFLVHGLAIPADSHSQLVADGSGLKSLVLLLVLGEMAKQGRPVLYLDWEWNAARHLARKRRLFGADRLETLFYLPCRQPLPVETDHIRHFCEQRAVEFLAIDSIGACCDGKLADDDVARSYNHALGALPPSLAAAHVPKNGTDPHADLKAFGSAFFHNFARMTWTVKKQPHPADEDIVTVLLAPHKQNDGTRLRPVALEFAFSTERIDVRGVDPAAVDGLAQTLPLRVRMMHLLKRGPLTMAQIADELGVKPDSVLKAVNRGEAFMKLTDTPDGVHRIALVERRTA
jgi:putative DNA primase/helicase